MQAKGDEDFESGTEILTSLQQERWQQRQQQQRRQQQELQAEALDQEDAEGSDVPAEYEDDDGSLGMTKTQARCFCAPIVIPDMPSIPRTQAKDTNRGFLAEFL